MVSSVNVPVSELGLIRELGWVTIRFAEDSGDGMQLTGTLFSDESALFGNDLATFPDYPSEIRAPAGTVAGAGAVSACRLAIRSLVTVRAASQSPATTKKP